jgi:predicted PilT family ATPase
VGGGDGPGRWARGSEGQGIVEYALEHGLLLVTQDQKPAELAELLGVKHMFITNAIVARTIDAGIREKYPSR